MAASFYRENKKKKLREKQQKIERGEDETSSEDEEDMEFDGGLKIPGSIWNKLYRYENIRWIIRWGREEGDRNRGIWK